MSAVAEFLFAVCSSSLIFSVITFLLPEKSGKAARLVASVFVLTVILKAGITAASSLPEIKTDVSQTASEYDRNGYIADITATALKKVIEERLRFAGCSFSEISVAVVYAEEGFSDLNISVTVEGERDKEIAQSVSRELNTEFEIRIG